MFYLLYAGQSLIIGLDYAQILPFHTSGALIDGYEIVIHYVVYMILPIHQFHVAYFVMTPFLLLGNYLVLKS